ncbi:MAG: heme o synthase, partial [Candidatus Krumholzibacteria bacterium]
PVLIHYVHRLGAVAVTVCVVLLVVRIVRNHREERGFLQPAVLLGAILFAQLLLGALTIWTRRAVLPTTAHVAFGAAILAVSLVLTLRSYRHWPAANGLGRSANPTGPATGGRALPRTRGRVKIGRSRVAATIQDYMQLTKPRIVLMILLTTMAGFYLGTHQSMDLLLLFHTLLGTALAVGSSNVLNQVMEREADGRMRRTRNRPLPAGRMDPREALTSGIGMAVVGFLYLLVAVNPLTALLTLVAWANYLFLYTPLKKKTSLSTLVGAVSGALPPVIGWAAVRGALSLESLALFSILFLWQLPHFLSIAWMYREDYARAGFAMLPVLDTEGSRTGRQIVFYGLALIPASLMPTLLGLTGGLYFFGALALGVAFLVFGIRTALYKSSLYARHLLFASLLFLPALLALMMLDKGAL